MTLLNFEKLALLLVWDFTSTSDSRNVKFVVFPLFTVESLSSPQFSFTSWLQYNLKSRQLVRRCADCIMILHHSLLLMLLNFQFMNTNFWCCLINSIKHTKQTNKDLQYTILPIQIKHSLSYKWHKKIQFCLCPYTLTTFPNPHFTDGVKTSCIP